VTARQLEGLIRLGEASARLKLCNFITIDDAQRAVRMLESCLLKVSKDPETGFIDADIIATGLAKSVRDKTKSVLDIIREMSKEFHGAVPKDAVLAKAQEMGIGMNKAEEIIDRLRRDGDIFEPRPGSLKLP